MVVRVCVALLGLLSATLACAGQAPSETTAPKSSTTSQQTAAPAAKVVDPRIAIAARIPGAKPEELRATPIPNIYELTHGADVAYVTADGKYAISGDLIDLPKNEDLTEEHRRDVRLKQIDAIPESEMLVFGPRDARYTVTVFTDVDCAYCRQLHSQIADYNRLGIRVRYLFYPRTGPNTESWTKAEQVWCSDNRNDALTRAKLDRPLQAKPCANNPVARDYALGRDFGVQGTPSIVTPNGELIGGYMPPGELLQELKKAQKQ
jgi:thiol:disulfide interchange protein DsbC